MRCVWVSFYVIGSRRVSEGDAYALPRGGGDWFRCVMDVGFALVGV